MATALIPRKQQSAQEDWTGALASAYASPDRERAGALVEQAAARIRARLPLLGRRAAYGWSGGKDSQVLRVVAELAGVTDCVLVISELEYPSFLAWATDHMPWGLTVEARPLDLPWLAQHPEMLFPQTAAMAGRWFSSVQHAGQRLYCRREQVDVLLLGRRRADGNFVGRNGADCYRDRDGFVRYSPLADWSHEDVLCVLGAHAIPLPPCYSWPRGFRVGTGAWAARQWCRDEMDGWAEVHAIDPSVVRHAASLLPGARAFLEQA